MDKPDLTAAFELIGQMFVRGLSKRIKSQVGIDRAAYYPPMGSTMRARNKARRIGEKITKTGWKWGSKGVEQFSKEQRAFAVGYKRLYVTGDLATNAFEYMAFPEHVTILATPEIHRSGNGRYLDIIKGNSRNFKRSPKHKSADNRPLVFPKTTQEVRLMRDEMNFADRQIRKAMTEWLGRKIPKKVEVIVG